MVPEVSYSTIKDCSACSFSLLLFGLECDVPIVRHISLNLHFHILTVIINGDEV